MANFNLDLSGISGLIPKTGSDSHLNTFQPQNQYIAGEGQMVSGEFNPFRKYGYMSPTTTSYRDVSVESAATLNNLLDRYTYDPETNELYATDGTTIFKTTSLDDVEFDEFLNPTTFTYDFFIIDFAYSNSGNNLYIVAQIDYDNPDTDNKEFIFQFDLTTAYDLNTATYTGNKADISNLSILSNTFNSFQVNYTGEHVYFGSFNDRTLYHYTISDYDISTLSNTGETLTSSDFPGLDAAYMFHVQDVEPSGSSRKVFAVGDEASTTNTAVESRNLNDSFETWSLASTSSGDLFTLNTTNDVYVQLKFQYGTNDGSRFFVVNQNDDLIKAYNLSTDWDISTATAGDTLAFPFGTAGQFGFNFNEDGTELVFSQEDDADDSFTPYTLSTGYDLSTATAGTGYDFLNISISEIHDIVLYEINSQKALYYSYTVDGDRDLLVHQVGVYNLETDESLVNWMSNYTSTDIDRLDAGESKLTVATNQFLYLTTDQYVYRISGSDLSGEYGALNDILRFDVDFYIDDVQDYREQIYIANHRGKDITYTPNYSNKCGVFIWDRQSTGDSFRDYITIEGVKKIASLFVTCDGTLGAITVNANDKAEVRLFSRNSFQIVAELERGAYPVDKSSVATGPNATWWIGNNGKVYAYGKLSPGDSNNMYYFGSLIAESDTPGIMFYGGQSAGTVSGDNWDEVESFYFSFDDGTPKIGLWAPHANADGDYPNQTSNQGNVYTPVKYLKQMSTLKYINIFCAQTDLSDSTVLATLKFYANQNTTPFLEKSITAADTAKGYIRLDFDKPYVNSFQMEVEWNNTLSLSEDLFFPSQANVYYEPTSTKG